MDYAASSTDVELEEHIPGHISLRRAGAAIVFPVAFYLLVSAAFTVGAYLAPQDIRPGLIKLACGATLAMAICHLFLRRALGGRLDPFTFDLVFLASFTAYSMGIWLQCLVGLIPFEATYSIPAYHHSTRAIMLCAAAAPAFLAGYLLGQLRPPQVRRSSRIRADWAAPALGRLGFFLFLVALIFRVIFIFVIVGAGSFFGRAYVTLTLHETPGYRLYGISEVFCHIGVATMAIGFAIWRGQLGPRVFWPIYALYVLLLIVDGERGTVFQSLLVLVLVRHLLIRRVRWWVLGLGLLVLLFVFAAVRIARALPERSIGNLLRAMKAPTEKIGPSSWLRETGGSFTAITRTMRWVPAFESYRYGKTVIAGLLTTVPFMTGLVSKIMGGTQAEFYTTPALWLTYRESGLVRPTSGLGYSSVAEAYLNFGIPGVPLVFFIIGFLLRKMEYGTFARPSLIRITLLVIMVGTVFYWARASLDIWVRPLAWAAILVWMAKALAGTRAVGSAPDSYTTGTRAATPGV